MFPCRNLLYSSVRSLIRAVALSVAFCHRDHAGALLTGPGFQQSPVQIDIQIMAEEVRQDFLGAGFEDDVTRIACQCLFRVGTGDRDALDLTNRQKLQHHRLLRHCINKTRRDNPDLIDFAF